MADIVGSDTACLKSLAMRRVSIAGNKKPSAGCANWCCSVLNTGVEHHAVCELLLNPSVVLSAGPYGSQDVRSSLGPTSGFDAGYRGGYTSERAGYGASVGEGPPPPPPPRVPPPYPGPPPPPLVRAVRHRLPASSRSLQFSVSNACNTRQPGCHPAKQRRHRVLTWHWVLQWAAISRVTDAASLTRVWSGIVAGPRRAAVGPRRSAPASQGARQRR